MKSDQCLISIIVPNYNHEKFLEQRLLSIINQGIQDYEIIFLDDASTDGSIDLVKKKFFNHIKHIEINKINTGSPFVQWNRGVALSKGKYIWIAESDDYCEPNFLEMTLRVMEKNHDVGIVYSKSVPVNAQDDILDADFYGKYVSELDNHLWLNDFILEGSCAVKKYFSYKNIITNVSGVIFRRSAYVAAGLAKETMKMCGDWMAYCTILKDWNIAYISNPLNYHRQHIHNHTKKSVADLTYFIEFMRVQKNLQHMFSLHKDYKKEAYIRILDECWRLTHDHLKFIDIFRLAWMLTKAYPNAANYQKIAKYVIYNSIKKLRNKWKVS